MHFVYVISMDSRQGFRIHLVVGEIISPSRFPLSLPSLYPFFYSLCPTEYEPGSLKPCIALMATLRPAAKPRKCWHWGWRNGEVERDRKLWLDYPMRFLLCEATGFPIWSQIQTGVSYLQPEAENEPALIMTTYLLYLLGLCLIDT